MLLVFSACGKSATSIPYPSITNLFPFMLFSTRSILACPCGWNSVKYESFFELALQLPPGNGKTSLRNCIENYLKTEDDVTYKCPK